MSDDLENLQRWVENKPLLGLPRRLPPAVPSSTKTDTVAQPFYFNVKSTGAAGVELWKNPANHADAAATVLTYSGKQVDFIPSLGLANQADKFNDYVRKISTFPGFVIENSQETGENVTSTNVDTMIGQIKNAYVGFATADLDGIVDSVEAMANSILNKSSKDSDKSLFSQDTISKTNNSTYITIFYATLQMHQDQQGKTTYIQQSYRIFRTLIRVNTTYLVTFADKLNSMIGDGDLDGWDQQGSSPTGNKLSCFEKQHKKAEREI
ncbi:hypothetical protein BGZ96_004209 [Linnemannia gamsii]|uniref:Uncharacterized protein n=1 Tax=Linnemannia gamsii TaxID=64522 RepID=A0ABQ7KIS3_9FUNG|nr:hypothetical protein BGZ96_004209 [Linnemannia gamsii]